MLGEDDFDAEEVGRQLQERSKVSDEFLRAAFYERRLAELRSQNMRQVDGVGLRLRGELTTLEEFGEAGFVAVVEDTRREYFIIAELGADQVKGLVVGETAQIENRPSEEFRVSNKRALERADRSKDRGFER